MLEEEARTKWCPMYRVGFNPEFPHNRIHDGKSGNCIASECMWWIWEVRRNEQGEQLKWKTGHCGAIK